MDALAGMVAAIREKVVGKWSGLTRQELEEASSRLTRASAMHALAACVGFFGGGYLLTLGPTKFFDGVWFELLGLAIMVAGLYFLLKTITEQVNESAVTSMMKRLDIEGSTSAEAVDSASVHVEAVETAAPSAPKGGSFGDKLVGYFIPIFVVLSGLAFAAKVQQGWSIGEWFRTEVAVLVFAVVSALIAAIVSSQD